MSEITPIRFENKADFHRWQDYVAARGDTHGTDRAGWRLLFKALYGIENYSFLCVESGRVRGCLSLYHIASPFLGRMLVTSPFFGYGGLYADSESCRAALLEKAESVARELGVETIEFRLKEKLGPPYEVNTDFQEFDLRLRETAESVWDRQLASNVRQNIRKSRRHPFTFSVTAAPGPCYELLCRTQRAHGTPFHGAPFFRLLLKHFPESVRFSEVRHAGELVAAGVMVRSGDSLSTPYIGSLKSHRNLGANYCQYWGIVEHCLREGIPRFELGRSPKGSSNAKFKLKWGAEPVQVWYNYRILRGTGTYRTVSRPARAYLLASRLWQRLPLFVTRSAGPRLFRYIP